MGKEGGYLDRRPPELWWLHCSPSWEQALSFMPLNCFQNLTAIARAREGSHFLLLVAQIQSARNCLCKAHVSPGYLWGLAVMCNCWWGVPTSEYRLWGKCSAGCGAQHRLAAWTHAAAFSLFGEWASRIFETSGFLFLSAFILYIVPSQSLTDLFFPLHALMHCSLFQTWNTLFSCFFF